MMRRHDPMGTWSSILNQTVMTVLDFAVTLCPKKMANALRCTPSNVKITGDNAVCVRKIYYNLARWRLQLLSHQDVSKCDQLILRVASYIDGHPEYQKLLSEASRIDIDNLHLLENTIDVDNFTMTHIIVTVLFIVDVLIEQKVINALTYSNWFQNDRPVIRRLIFHLGDHKMNH